MKGFTTSIFILMVAVALIANGLWFFLLSQDVEGQNKKTVFQKDYHTVSTALEAANLYLQTSLVYSVYQALYEAGLDDKVWYNNEKVNIQKDFLSRLKPTIDLTLIKYTRDSFTFLNGNYIIDLPQYLTNVKLENGTLTAEASSNETLRVEKSLPEESISLEKTVRMSETFSYRPIMDAQQFLEGVNGTDIIKQSAAAYFNKTWGVWGETSLSGCENKRELKNIDVFNSLNNRNFSDSDQAKQNISAELSETILSMNLSKYPTVSVIPTTSIALREDCSATKKIDECDKQPPRYEYTKSCNFTYVYQINTTVIIENSEKYPVKTKTGAIDFVNQHLEFKHILSSEHKA